MTVGDVRDLAVGAGILGTGGGGDPRLGRLRLRRIFEDDTHADGVDLVAVEDLPDDAHVVGVGGMGAPTVSDEKFSKGDEELRGLRAIEDLAGVEVDAVVGFEIGGKNSMAPLSTGALADLPVVDGDGMGRAFPELQMTTFFIYGGTANYAALTDERGNQVIYRDIDSPERLENLARANTVEVGGRAGVAFPLMDGAFARDAIIPDTVTLAGDLGRRVREARRTDADPVAEVCAATAGRRLFEGKVTDVYRRTTEGFARGTVTLEGIDGATGELRIELQNEFLVALDEADDPVATVPDLICLVDRDTAAPIPSSAVRYGQRVAVLGIPAHDELTTDAALSVIGPAAFGYDYAYDPLEPAPSGEDAP